MQESAVIAERLRDAGAPEKCWAMSSNPDIDGRAMQLDEALDETVGSTFGTLLICIPGHLAYFEGEEPGERYLLKR